MSPPPDSQTPASELPHLKREGLQEFKENEYVTFSESFSLAKRRLEFIFPLKESELNRIEGLIAEIVPQRKLFRTLWSLLVGIAATSGFSLLGFRLANNVPAYVWDLGFVILGISLVLGIAFLVLDLREPDKVSRSKEDALRELRFVKSQFDSGEQPQDI